MQTDEDIGKVAAPVPVILCILREKLRLFYGEILPGFVRQY